MLNISLDSESEQYLSDIISDEKISSDDLIKRLLKDYWLSRKSTQQTILERLGGYPQNVIVGAEDLSDRDTRKNTILEKLRHRHGSI